MIQHFEALTKEEFEQLKDAIALITVLIAGADGNIDSDETAWAEKITNIRSYASNEILNEFYQEVGVDFSEKLEAFINDFPDDVDTRSAQITDRLIKLNSVLAKLHPRIGAKLYDDYVSFAEHVAKASGGFLRFFSVSYAEKKYIGLSMIDPIVYDPETEEDQEEEND